MKLPFPSPTPLFKGVEGCQEGAPTHEWWLQSFSLQCCGSRPDVCMALPLPRPSAVP